MYVMAATLLVLWLLGLVTSFTVGGLIHGLLVVALVMILLKVFENPCDGWE